MSFARIHALSVARFNTHKSINPTTTTTTTTLRLRPHSERWKSDTHTLLTDGHFISSHSPQWAEQPERESDDDGDESKNESKSKASVGSTDDDGGTGTVGRRSEQEECVRELLKCGVNVNQVEDETTGDTLLHALCHERNQAMAAFVLSSLNANREARNRKGHTPLHTAVIAHTATVVRVLIDAGAFVNAVDGSGNTPLHLVDTHKDSAGSLSMGEFGDERELW